MGRRRQQLRKLRLVPGFARSVGLGRLHLHQTETSAIAASALCPEAELSCLRTANQPHQVLRISQPMLPKCDLKHHCVPSVYRENEQNYHQESPNRFQCFLFLSHCNTLDFKLQAIWLVKMTVFLEQITTDVAAWSSLRHYDIGEHMFHNG